MSDDLIEFLKNEYVPKSSIRYIKQKLVNERCAITGQWSSMSDMKGADRVQEIDKQLELVNMILKM